MYINRTGLFVDLAVTADGIKPNYTAPRFKNLYDILLQVVKEPNHDQDFVRLEKYACLKFPLRIFKIFSLYPLYYT